jgi:hypothetical protein
MIYTININHIKTIRNLFPITITFLNCHLFCQVTFGISRFGSGSHLMALLYAKTLGDLRSEPLFKVVNTMQGAREAMLNKEIDVFLWDRQAMSLRNAR